MPRGVPTVNELSAAAEDCLKAIHKFAGHDGAAAIHELAPHLGLARASVSGMLGRLADARLAVRQSDHRVQLTAEGQRVALRTLRRHNILSCYLSAVLNFSREDADDEAERLEHAASDDVIDRMAASLRSAHCDPSGTSVPALAVALAQPEGSTLKPER